MSKNNRVVVLLSGNGSNLQALLDQQPNYCYEIVGVISNQADAIGLQRAEKANIPAITVDPKAFVTREAYDEALITHIDALHPSLVVLAGYMRILTAPFVKHYQSRLVNIHPSLLPSYKGLNTYQRVLADKQNQHGTTIHFVTDELDGGAIILQASLEISPQDNEQSLCKRVQKIEHRVYPMTVHLLTSGRISLSGEQVHLDNTPLGNKGYQLTEQTIMQL